MISCALAGSLILAAQKSGSYKKDTPKSRFWEMGASIFFQSKYKKSLDFPSFADSRLEELGRFGAIDRFELFGVPSETFTALVGRLA
jgi:hypothetical protein